MDGTERADSVGFVGTGEISAALVRGLSRSADHAPMIYLSPRGRRLAAELAAEFPNVRVCSSNAEVVACATSVVIAVRPDVAADVLRELAFGESQLVISVVAALRLAAVRDASTPAARVVRAIPLPAVARGEGLTALYPDEPAASALFERVGDVVPTDSEAALDALSAATATVAAHVDIAETITAWLNAHDVHPDLARRYVAQTLGRLGEAFLHLDDTWESLARRYTTPGGLNAQFRDTLRSDGLPASIRKGLDEVLARVRAASDD